MMSEATRLVERYKVARIDHITKAYIRTYEDNDTTKAYVEWVDEKGKPGRTEGDPEGAHMKALLDRAKREKIKVENQKWASDHSSEWIAREAARRNEWLIKQGLGSELVAGSLTTQVWDRTLETLTDTAEAMKKQVSRFGGIENALKEGHGTTLGQQLNEMSSVLRVLQRRLGG
jgi:hypothetical protein